LSQEQKDTEKLPCSEVIEVLGHNQVYKTAKWWMEAVGGVMFGKRKLFVYLWILDSKIGKWKRKGKLTIGSKQNWDQIKQAVEGRNGYEKSLLELVFG